MASDRGRLRCWEQNIQNAEVITADMNYYDPGKRFDRIRSVEMFMHMRNYKQLLRKIASWVKPDGGLFVHREYAYLFETEGEYNWMGRHLFSGGIAPSVDLLLYFQDGVVITDHLQVSGIHYETTSNHWRVNMGSGRMLSFQSLNIPMERKTLRYGSSSGGSSSWPAPSCGGSGMGRSGG